jgi:tRNA threonylcarbamoyladenosine biosynthesis protein TsaE
MKFHPSDDKTMISCSPEETWDIAESLVAALPNRAVIALHGELGSGKTCFVQGIAAALRIARAVTSPTFTMINEYRGRRPLFHLDLYRIKDPDELLAIGMEEYIERDGIVAIEWAERAGDLLPAETTHVYFTALARPDERRLRVVMPP